MARRAVLWIVALWSTAQAVPGLARPAQIDRQLEQANALLRKQDYAAAIVHYAQVLDWQRQTGEGDSLVCNGLINGGCACQVANRYIEGFEFFTAALQLAEKHHLKDQYRACVNNIANTYMTFQDSERAVHYYQLAYLSSLESAESHSRSIYLSNLVEACCNTGRVDEARKYLRLQMQTEWKDRDLNNFHILHNQGLLAHAEQNYYGDIYYQRLATQYVRDHGLESDHEAAALTQMGKSYQRIGRADSALACYRLVIALTARTPNMEHLLTAYDALAEIFRQQNRPDSAERYRAMKAALADSVFNQRMFSQSKGVLEQYEQEVNDELIHSLDRRINQQWWIIVGITAVLLFVALTLLVIYRLYARLRSAHRLLIGKNEELSLQNEANMRLRQQYLAAMNEKRTTSAQSAAGNRLPAERKAQMLNDIAQVMENTEVISDPEFNMAQLARMIGSNTAYVSAIINETYRKNFKTYLNDFRIREACRRLVDTERYGHLTIQAIAGAVGFNSPTSFIAAFKKVMGMTPSVYKRLYEEREEQSVATPPAGSVD